MDKKKMLLIGGGIAAVGIVAYLLVRKGNSGTISTSNTSSGNCPAGQVPCSNNRLKCYDPMANYLVNPCTSSNTSNNTTDPVYQIIDGVIKLFRKKPATTAPTA
jgi:hypothetical protein